MVPERKVTPEDIKYMLSSHYQGTPYDPYRSYGGNGSCNACDVCQGLVCADCCCECMGGDLIPCC